MAIADAQGAGFGAAGHDAAVVVESTTSGRPIKEGIDAASQEA